MTTSTTKPRAPLTLPLAILAAAALLGAGCARKPPAAGPTAGTAPHFATPQAAVDALLAACRANDEARVVAVFGETARPIVSTGDPAADRERCEKLLEAAGQSTRLDPKGADTVEVVVGSDDWTLPIPLVRDASGWRFDVEAGMHEIARRRIGANEIEAITACHVYVHAQNAYARRGTNGKGVYAQRFVSTSGKKDGLYWPDSNGKDPSPLAPIAATLGDAAPGTHPPGVWRGYRFRILTAQGPNAPGGARSYLPGSRMTGGFALVAYPAVYGSSGVMTFIVGADGHVYEKDLGEKTDGIAAGMTAYDPDPSWKRVGS